MRLRILSLLVALACGLGLFGTPHMVTAQQPGKVYYIDFLSLLSPPAASQPDDQQRSLYFQSQAIRSTRLFSL